jgi:hypothetical protein
MTISRLSKGKEEFIEFLEKNLWIYPKCFRVTYHFFQKACKEYSISFSYNRIKLTTEDNLYFPLLINNTKI